MKSKVVVYTSRALGLSLLLCGGIGLVAWGTSGGVGSQQVELLVISFVGIWFGGRVLDMYGGLG